MVYIVEAKTVCPSPPPPLPFTHLAFGVAMDISADLTELGRTPLAVVSAGAKSILDLGRTLEFLETQGVTVATYGPEKDFPAFFSRRSGFQVRTFLRFIRKLLA